MQHMCLFEAAVISERLQYRQIGTSSGDQRHRLSLLANQVRVNVWLITTWD